MRISAGLIVIAGTLPAGEHPRASSLVGACRAAFEEVRAEAWLHPEIRDPRVLLLAGEEEPGATEEARLLLKALFLEAGLVPVERGARASGPEEAQRAEPLVLPATAATWVGEPAQVFRVEVLRAGGREVLCVVPLRPAADPILIPFARKPWVGDPGAWSAGRPGRRVFLGASGLRVDPGEAEREAILDAARRVREAAGAAAAPRPPAATGVSGAEPGEAIPPRWVKDRHVEELRRPGQTFYRGHALVEVDAADLRRLAAGARAEARRERRREAARIGGGAVLLLLLAGGTAFADRATRGYLRTPLRLLALAAGTGIVLLIFGGNG